MVHVHLHVGQHWQKAQAATATIACLSGTQLYESTLCKTDPVVCNYNTPLASK